jgi:hypothetical protein
MASMGEQSVCQGTAFSRAIRGQLIAASLAGEAHRG